MHDNVSNHLSDVQILILGDYDEREVRRVRGGEREREREGGREGGRERERDRKEGGVRGRE